MGSHEALAKAVVQTGTGNRLKFWCHRVFYSFLY